MTPENWRRVDEWWSDLFGAADVDVVARRPVVIGMHAGLGDYLGVFVAARHGSGARVPAGVGDAGSASRELEHVGSDALAARAFWESWSHGEEMVVLGPAVHAFTDREPVDVTRQHRPTSSLATVDDLDGPCGPR